MRPTCVSEFLSPNLQPHPIRSHPRGSGQFAVVRQLLLTADLPDISPLGAAALMNPVPGRSILVPSRWRERVSYYLATIQTIVMINQSVEGV